MMAPQMPPNQGMSGNPNNPPANSPFYPNVRTATPSLANAASPLAQAVSATTLSTSVTTTATYSPGPSIFSQITSVVSTTTVFPQAQITPASTHTHHNIGGNQYPPQQQQQNIGGNVGGLSGGVLAAAGVIATLIVVLLLAACCCVIFRKRRRRSPSAPAIMQPMIKTPGPKPVARAHVRNQEPAAAASLTSPSTTSAPSTNTNTQHVLLTTTMDQSYYTGIDTSDAISLAERQPQPATAMSDEPPPPYRPRSVPPVSRGNSLCVTDGLAGYQPGQNMRSPFDDPVDEDDGLSDLGNYCGGRDVDRLSAVSDLSYQEEPTAVRSGV
jgi:hypothetical protein